MKAMKCKECELSEQEAVTKRYKCSVTGEYVKAGEICNLPIAKITKIVAQLARELVHRGGF